MTRSMSGWAGVVAALLLCGCGEKAQTTTASAKKSDTPAYEGAHDPFVAPGWKAGDKASWEQQVRTRAQSQNEYSRLTAQ
jgi:hypothetical protein